MGYAPLADYGLIGNLETCALVSRGGSVDWLCLPTLESPSAFAAILDDEVGGRFSLRPADEFEAKQSYVADTNVLRTAFTTDGGRLVVTDFMPILGQEYPDDAPRHALYRTVTCTSGEVTLSAAFRPRLDYARATTTFEDAARGVVARGGSQAALLSSDRTLDVGDDEATGEWTLAEDETAWFCLQYPLDDTDANAAATGDDGTAGGETGAADDVADAIPALEVDAARCDEMRERTVDHWREWTATCDTPGGCVEDGEYYDVMRRSALALKLLIHCDTAAIAAAPTTSLPEDIGGVRNWDYRFNWIRDAAFTVQALYKMGHVDEARGYFEWCLDRIQTDDPESAGGPLFRPLYGLQEDALLEEKTLDHLEGYRQSSPVRIGNDAHRQRQLDVYGELLLAIYEVSRFDVGSSVAGSNWDAVCTMVDHVCDVWDCPDYGIWEVRTEPKHFVHSKVMCWAALDRGVKLVEEGRQEDGADFDADVARWRRNRDRVRDRVLSEGYDDSRGAFTRTFSGDELDAACLRIPVVGFLPFDDERVQGTIDAVRGDLAAGGGLVSRYEGDDGLPGEDNPFVLCSFWLVDALALSGRTEEARETFECVRSYTSPHGLLAEEVDPDTGEQRGNFPQAFSHIGLINSALYLRRETGQSDDDGVVGEPEPPNDPPTRRPRTRTPDSVAEGFDQTESGRD